MLLPDQDNDSQSTAELVVQSPTLCPPGGRQRDQLSLPSPIPGAGSAGYLIQATFQWRKGQALLQLRPMPFTVYSLHSCCNECCFDQELNTRLL